MSRVSKGVVYISDGDDDEDGEIVFAGSSNLKRLPARPVALVLDDDDEDDQRNTPSDEDEGIDDTPLPNILDIFASDPPAAIDICSPAVVTVDRKGKGRAVDPGPAPRIRGSSAARRIGSPVFDGIEDEDEGEVPLALARKRKTPALPAATAELKRSKTVTIESTSVSPVKLSKADKEAAKVEEKKRKQLEKDKAKADKEAEKSFQRKLADANRLRTSKNDALREIHLYLSADLQLPSCPLAGALPEITARITESYSQLHYLPEDESPIPGMIKFKRHVKSRYDHDRKAWIPIDEPRWEWEGTIVVIVMAEEVTDMISADGLRDWVGDVRLALSMRPSDQLIVMIKGLNKYYSKLKSLQNKEYTAAARAGMAGKTVGGVGSGKSTALMTIGRDEVEMELVRVQMETRCFLVHVEKTEDIEDWVFNLAGDVAIRPYKLLSKAHLSFCATDGIKKGSTPGDVFELMLQEVQGITPSAAAGIRSEYENFQILMDAYERAEKRGGRERAEMMLQDCEIKNLRSGVASGRKLNKALSKRVYNVFRGQDSLALV